nr:PREDICTED: uncharacterized protein LOC109633078 [Paralichthys olivaceus]
MWSVDVLILLLFCYACLSIGNEKVRFVSKNFHNILHWDPVEPTSAGEKVLYSVQYMSYDGEQFQIKPECQNISALTCDLTAETPSVPDVHYHAKVLVNGRVLGRTVTRFKPIAETTLGAPNLTTYTTVSSLFVNVTLPLGPNGVSVAEIISKSKNGPSKVGIIYTLHITEPEWAALVNENTTGRFVINLKNNRTKYCGHVFYKPFSEYGRAVSEKALFCVTLPDNPQMLLPWLYSIAAFLVVVIVISVTWTCNYLKGGKKANIPQSLKVTTSGIFKHQKQSSDNRIIISTPVVSCPSELYPSIQVKPHVSSDRFGGYSPQDMPFLAWQGSSGSSEENGAHSPTSNQLEMSSQSSEIYSSVAAHIPVDKNQHVQQATTDETETCNLPLPFSSELCDKGGPKLMSHGVHPLPDLDACETNAAIPLQLHTVRDDNGQLVLPSLTPQLQNCTGDTLGKPLLSALIDSDEEGPFLASLHSLESMERWDSGCVDSTVNTPTQPYANSHYFQSQAPVPHLSPQCQNTPSCDETGYKQNWMPAILHDAASKDNSEYRRTNCKWNWTPPKEEEEGEGDDGGEERSKQIVLGSWMVQIQE